MLGIMTLPSLAPPQKNENSNLYSPRQTGKKKSSSSKTNHLAKRILHAPNPRPQARQLHNLTMIDEQIDIDAKFADIPIKHGRLSRFKHDLFHGQLLQDGLDDVGALARDVFRDAFEFDHETLDAGGEEGFAQGDEFGRRAGATLGEG